MKIKQEGKATGRCRLKGGIGGSKTLREREISNLSKAETTALRGKGEMERESVTGMHLHKEGSPKGREFLLL